MFTQAPLALADQPTNGAQVTPAPQVWTVDSVNGHVVGAPVVVDGVAMTVDAEGHPRVFCADPADSLAPAAMRDAIEPSTSRLRYE